MRTFVYALSTVSGSDRAEVRLGDRDAEIEVRSNWAGVGLRRYRLACRRDPLGESFGTLTVTAMHAATADDAPYEPVPLGGGDAGGGAGGDSRDAGGGEDDPFLYPLVLEYVLVPPSLVFVHPASSLQAMGSAGDARWNETFELLLLVHDFESRADRPPIAEVCGVLDKRKFAAKPAEDAGG